VRRVVVIGGSGTVGRGVVAELLEQEARVACTHHRSPPPEGVIARQLDAADTDTIAPCLDALAGELGGLDALIYCAGVGSTCEPQRFDGLEDVTAPGWDRLMAINVRGAFFAARRAARHMDKGGNIVLMGSVDGIKPVPTPVPYAVSKAALRGMVLSLTKALGDRNIRVNLVAPGILEDGASRIIPDDLRAEYLKHAGLRRFGQVSEVTGVVAWLALTNTYVTGATVMVDGGL
jgi:NAD(P)-dependent dehydrogenase (short-subunit alcohol dehydrogenase family)